MIYKKIEIAVDGYKETADLYTYFLDNSIEMHDIFDVSGGDMANEVLPYLDFSVIAASTDPDSAALSYTREDSPHSAGWTPDSYHP